MEEMKLWCFEDADLICLQEILSEPLPRSVGKRCYKTWNELGALDIKKLVDQKIYVIDDYLYIEEKEIKPAYKGETVYEGQVDENDQMHGVGKWTTFQIITDIKDKGEILVDHANIGCVYEGSFRKG